MAMGRCILFLFLAVSISLKGQLPIVCLQGDFGYDYQEGKILLIEDEDTIQLSANIKWRGGTTNTPDKHKRNYKIKLSEDISLLGLRKDNNWILDAGQADVFRLRNRIATELWNDLAEKPYYQEKEKNVRSGVEGRVVEVYLNDEYYGIYCLTEVMDRKQLKLRKFDKETGEIHGGLWKATGYGCATMWETVPYDNHSDTWDVFEVKYPKLDDVEETDYSTLYDAIHFVAYSDDETFKNQVNAYFDMPVIIDYFIFINTLNAFDNRGKNIFWAVHDKQEDKKLTLAVWDLDATVGQKWILRFISDSTSPFIYFDSGIYLYDRLQTLNADNFNDRVIKRYKELRNGILSTDSLIHRYTYYYNMLKENGAAEREEQRWSEDSDVNGEVIDFKSEMLFIQNWITQHMSYLDREIFKTTNIERTTIDNNHKNLYNLNGQKMKDDSILRKGIYIKGGKKYIVK